MGTPPSVLDRQLGARVGTVEGGNVVAPPRSISGAPATCSGTASKWPPRVGARRAGRGQRDARDHHLRRLESRRYVEQVVEADDEQRPTSSSTSDSASSATTSPTRRRFAPDAAGAAARFLFSETDESFIRCRDRRYHPEQQAGPHRHDHRHGQHARRCRCSRPGSAAKLPGRASEARTSSTPRRARRWRHRRPRGAGSRSASAGRGGLLPRRPRSGRDFRCRPAARASRSIAKFTQAMSSTRRPRQALRAAPVRTSPTNASRSGGRWGRCVAFVGREITARASCR